MSFFRTVALASGLTAALAATAGAQGSLGAPRSKKAAETVAKSDSQRVKHDNNFSTSIGMIAFGSLLDGPVAETLTARLSGIAASGFKTLPAWHFVDAAAAPAIDSAMHGAQSSEEFESAVRIAQGHWTSTRYLLAGLLQNARDDTTLTNDRRVAHNITLEYRVRISDVQTKETVLDSTIRIASADVLKSKSTAITEVKNSAFNGAVDKLRNRFGAGGPVHKDEGLTSKAVNGVVTSYTRDEAMDRVLSVAQQRFASLAASALTLAANAKGDTR